MTEQPDTPPDSQSDPSLDAEEGSDWSSEGGADSDGPATDEDAADPDGPAEDG